jgi:hypothetical protein
MKTLYILLLGAILFAALSFTTPDGWFIAGSATDKYQMGIDTGRGMNRSNAMTIQSNTDTINGFGTLVHNFSPQQYLGKKIRVRGMMKSVDVNHWASFWMRVDGAGGKELLAFDNMNDRVIKGTTPWRRYEIVLDVPEGATNISFGALLAGNGKIWFDQVVFEQAPQSSKTTGLKLRKEPNNLISKQ